MINNEGVERLIFTGRKVAGGQPAENLQTNEILCPCRLYNKDNIYLFWKPKHYFVEGNVTLFIFIRGWWLKVRSYSHNYIRWDRRKMFNDFDTCLHYLEARVYHSINKSDSQTEAIHLKSLPHKCSSTNKAPAPWFKSSWIKLS